MTKPKVPRATVERVAASSLSDLPLTDFDELRKKLALDLLDQMGEVEAAWGLIANAWTVIEQADDWPSLRKEWIAAAKKWRDNYTPTGALTGGD
jgi:hypothetical protein